MTLQALFPPQKPPVWIVRIFVILYGIIWIVNALKFIPRYISFWKHLSGYAALYTALAIFMVLMLYWLFRLDKKGWAMLMFSFCYNVISILFDFYNRPDQDGVIRFRTNNTGLYVSLLLCALVLYYFNRKDVLNTFQVSRGFRLLVFLVSIVIVAMHIFLSRDGSRWNYYF